MAATVGGGQPTIKGFSWHCSAQVSNSSKLPEGCIACTNSIQANCAYARRSADHGLGLRLGEGLAAAAGPLPARSPTPGKTGLRVTKVAFSWKYLAKKWEK